MDFLKIINKYYPIDNELKEIYMVHAEKVTEMALAIAQRHKELAADEKFIKEAAMLHDLGIFLTDAPRIHCHGKEKYICHGYLGAELLRKEGFDKHALVCERHTGTGITKEAIIAQNLPLPLQDFTPQSIEEQIICFADKYYSKTKFLYHPRTTEQMIESMRKISDEAAEKAQYWCSIFL